MAKKKMLYVVTAGVVCFLAFSSNEQAAYFGEKDCKNGCGSKILNRRPSGATPVRAARALMLSPPTAVYADPNYNFTEANEFYNRRPSGVTPVMSPGVTPGGATPVSASNGTLVVVFVSFSMPEVSLKELDENAEKYGAILVMRGLFEGSFVKTKEKILAINKNGLHLDINPELFRRYNIYRVPTFVLLENGKEVHRLSGNVTLEYASAKLREK